MQVGVLIGKQGETIRNMQNSSGAKIQVTKDGEADPNAPTRLVELIGSLESVDKAEQLIRSVIAEVHWICADSLILVALWAVLHLHTSSKISLYALFKAEAGGSPALVARGFGGGQPGLEQFEMTIPDNKVLSWC